MSESRQPSDDEPPADLLRHLEQRLDRIERHLGLTALEDEGARADATTQPPAPVVSETPTRSASPSESEGDGDDLEFELGQTWFAKIGVVVLALGVAFLLSLPFADLPAVVPSISGYGLSLVLFLLAHAGRRSFDLVARTLRGAAMALLCFASLRLIFFGQTHVFDAASPLAWGILIVVVALNVAIALARRSPLLLALAAATGCVSALAIDSPVVALSLTTALVLMTVYVCLRKEWTALPLIVLLFVGATYALIALGNPLLGHAVAVVHAPLAGPGLLLVWGVAFALGMMLRRGEDALSQFGTVLNVGLCYGLYLLHTVLGFSEIFFAAHLVAAIVFLGVAVACWLKSRSAFHTFVYAMTGYMALSFAIIKISSVPDVFVWLSLQSLLVVTTAIWFRSRFIVVSNFAIYVAIVIAYVAMAPRESGISLGFGIVALVSARLLNWKKDRLELQTELMRNAYLVVAFAVFPYSTYHLIPEAFVIPAWIGIAVLYYVMNGIIRNRKYRWMGHLTLLLTAAYAMLVGTNRLEPAYRVISFIVLGLILLIVSLVFTRARGRARGQSKTQGG